MISYKNFEQFKEICANNNCKLVAVSKRSPASEILELHQKGQMGILLAIYNAIK